jgi:hypothetical protein
MQCDKLNKAEWAAIDYLGSHPKAHAKIGTGKQISTRTFNQLYQLGLLMWVSEEHKIATLSASGQSLWNQRHHTSKHKRTEPAE